jgi:hypothetical protein
MQQSEVGAPTFCQGAVMFVRIWIWYGALPLVQRMITLPLAGWMLVMRQGPDCAWLGTTSVVENNINAMDTSPPRSCGRAGHPLGLVFLPKPGRFRMAWGMVLRNGPSLRAWVWEEAVRGAFIKNSNGSEKSKTNSSR